MTTNEPIRHYQYHSMATSGTSQAANTGRPLPKVRSPNPPGASSDETPRTVTGDGSARQRRRAQNQTTREKTPSGRETVSPSPAKEISLPPRAEPIDDRQMKKRRKARRRVKSASQLQPEPSLLQGFEDEVIVEKSRKASELALPDLLLSSSHAAGTASKSAATPRIYFENKKTFSSVNKDAVAARFGTKPGQLPFGGGYDDHYTFQQQTAEVLKRFTVHVAKQTHLAFQKFFLFIHGINSGYALWVCVFAFVFTNGNSLGFFNTYRTIAMITHLLFYLFLALCMVDVLDRIDPVKFNRTVLLQCITAQNSAVAFLFYAVAMVVNLVMMQTEDYLRMTEFARPDLNQTYLTVNEVATNQTNTWRNLTAVRAAFIVAGWIIVSIHIKNDRLSTMIKNTEEKAFYEELQIEQNTIPIVAGVTSA